MFKIFDLIKYLAFQWFMFHEGEDGGGDAGTVVAEPGAVDTGAVDPGAVDVTPLTSGEVSNPPSDAPEPMVLTTLPPKDSAEYEAEFDKLPMDKRLQVEKELNELPNNKEMQAELEKYLESLKPKEGDKPAEGEKLPAAGDESEIPQITAEEIQALPENAQKVLISMQESLNKLSDFSAPEVQRGLDTLVSDPIVALRIKEINEGLTTEKSIENIKKSFNPNDFASADDIARLDFVGDRQASMQLLSNMLLKAANHGNSAAKQVAELEKSQIIHMTKLQNETTKQLDQLVADNKESLKSDLPYEHPDSPVGKFTKWAEERVSAEQFRTMTAKTLYAAYLADSGTLDKAMSKIANNSRLQFIKGFEEMQDKARTIGSRAPASKNKDNEMYKGIDLTRYKNDLRYAEAAFDKADWPTQQKLEQFRATGKMNKD